MFGKAWCGSGKNCKESTFYCLEKVYICKCTFGKEGQKNRNPLESLEIKKLNLKSPKIQSLTSKLIQSCNS